MYKCPNCGRYMESYFEQIWSGARLVYVCACGYSTRDISGTVACNSSDNIRNKNAYENRGVIYD